MDCDSVRRAPPVSHWLGLIKTAAPGLRGSYLFDDCVAVWKILLIVDGRQTVASYDTVKLLLCLLLNLGIRGMSAENHCMIAAVLG
jgi:hypothetical protein